MNKARIEKAALDIYTKHIKRGTPAASLAKIIKNEGLWYSEIDSNNKDFLGVLIKTPNVPLHIMVKNNIEPIGRKNFTIAHEFGHYVLEHTLNSSSIICNKISEECDTTSDQEDEANYFARCFLMPRERIIKEFTNWYKWQVSPTGHVYLHVQTSGNTWHLWKRISSKLTKQFGVSSKALKIRLVELNFINNFKTT